MEKRIQPGYWAVLPANVRYDRSLTPTAKLLYAEISSLSADTGYCWATDKYFAELFMCSEATITRSMKLLSSAGYIRVEKTTNTRGTERHIFCGVFPVEKGTVKNEGTLDGTLKIEGNPPVVDDGTPPPTHYKRNNNKASTGARGRARTRARGELSPEVDSVFSCFAAGNADLYHALVDFARARAKNKDPIPSDLAATKLVNKLQRLSKGVIPVMVAMLDKAIERGWSSVYELKPDEMPKTDPGRVEESPGVKVWSPGGGQDE